MKKFYKIINSGGWVLSNRHELACEMVLGYGGTWTKDHRKAKRFDTIKQCQDEINKMPCRKGEKFLVVDNTTDWKKAFRKAKNESRL